MRHTLLLYSNPEDFSDATEEEMAQQLKVFGEYIAALKTAGVFVDTDWLVPGPMAKSLSLKTGKPEVHDGPFADTKEQLGGFFIIDVPDLDAALKWAERCPASHYGTVEVRASAMPEGGNPHG